MALGPEERLVMETRESAKGAEGPLLSGSLTWLTPHSVDLAISCPGVLTAVLAAP